MLDSRLYADYAPISDLRASEPVPPAFIYSYGESLVEFTDDLHPFSFSSLFLLHA